MFLMLLRTYAKLQLWTLRKINRRMRDFDEYVED